MASGFFLLLDDIASVLDDVAALTKLTVKKASGVLGDDLALNAEQVAGVEAKRELPLIWAVAKGSAVNKVILVIGSLVLSSFLPQLITPLLIAGGLYLCYEGVEKILHKYLHTKEQDEEHTKSHKEKIATPEVDIVQAEKQKISGAIRTDFILSAEIMVISLDVVAEADFIRKLLVLSVIAILMTVGVYGLVAGIVKLDDLGTVLVKSRNSLVRSVGEFILWGAPYFMKLLSIVGTIAMFLVGGGILVHKIGWVHHVVENFKHSFQSMSQWIATPAGMAMEGIVGLLAGALAVVVVQGGKRLFGKVDSH